MHPGEESLNLEDILLTAPSKHSCLLERIPELSITIMQVKGALTNIVATQAAVNHPKHARGVYLSTIQKR